MHPSAPEPDLAVRQRTSPLTGLLLALGALNRSGVVLIGAVLSDIRLGLLAVALVVVAGVVGVAQWWRRTWSFDGAVLEVDEGVLVRKERRIPVERVQHVELERRLRHQLLGLAEVRVETAGGSQAELQLDAVPLPVAVALRGELLAAASRVGSRATLGEAVATATDADGPRPAAPRDPAVHAPDRPPSPVSSPVLVQLSPARLAAAGVTGSDLLVLGGVLGFVLDTLGDAGIDLDTLGQGAADAADRGLSALLAAVAALAAVTVWLGSAAIVSVVRRWDLRAELTGGQLVVRAGLLRRTEVALDLGRVQDARISAPPLRRLLGRADLRLRSAGSSSREGRSSIEIPMLAPAEIDRVLAAVLPVVTSRPPLVPAPPAARTRSWLRAGIGPALASLAVVVAAPDRLPDRPALVVLAAAVVALAVAFGELSWRAKGLGVSDTVVVVRDGALFRETELVPAERIQSSAAKASPTQRWRRLTHLSVDLPGRRVTAKDRPIAERPLLVGPDSLPVARGGRRSADARPQRARSAAEVRPR